MQNQKSIKIWFIHGLLEGTHHYSGQQLQELACQLGLQFNPNHFFCAVIRISDCQIQLEKNLDVWKKAKRMISQSGLNCEYCVGEKLSDLVLLLSEKKETAMAALQKVCKWIKRQLNVSVGAAISCQHNKLEDVVYAKNEAYDALQQLLEDETSVTDAQSWRLNPSTSETFSQNEIKEIISRFKRGDIKDIDKSLSLLAEKVRKNTAVQIDAPYPTSIRRTMIEIMIEIMHYTANEGVEVDAAMGNVDPYRIIMGLRSTPEIIDWITEAMVKLDILLQARHRRVEELIIERAKNYIDANISNIELSLTTVSTELGISPAYFSAFFIREAGIGFKDYVTGKRIDRAHYYLVNTKESINKIAEYCGFLSPSYFISVFKKQMGVSPGVYRKQKT